MQFLYSSYVLLLFLVAAVTLLLTVYCALRYGGAQAKFLAGAFASVGIMALSAALSALSATPETADIWLSKSRFIGVVSAPVFLLLFVLAHEQHRSRWLSAPRILALMVIPCITLAVAWSNERHGWFFEHVDYVRYGDFLFRESWKAGTWFWAHTAYSYALLVWVIVLLVQNIRQARYPWRGQAMMLFVGALFPVLTNIIALMHIAPGPALDLTSFGLTATALTFFWALYHYRLLHILPMAGEQILENMQDAVLVVDSRGRIIHANPALLGLLGLESLAAVLGETMDEVLPQWLKGQERVSGDRRRKTFVVSDGQEHYYQVNSAPLYWKNQGKEIGNIILLHDITELTHTMQERERLIGALKNTQSELEVLATTDALTDLYNRRFFYENAEQEFERSARYQRPLSVIMLDVDHFKRINDTYGHVVGDQILRAIADTIKGSVRNVDLLARFGGEEFIVLLPETGQSEALCLAERILNRVKACAVLHEGKRIATTVSAGIADIMGSDGNLEDLIRRADAALYQAKEKGRDRICLSD